MVNTMNGFNGIFIFNSSCVLFNGISMGFYGLILDLMGSNGIYPLVVTKIAMEAMAIEIVSFDNNKTKTWRIVP